MKISRISLAIMFLYLMVTILMSPGVACSESGAYLIGIFGVPEGDFVELKKAGINSVLVRENEIEKSKSLNLNKIYVIGVTPKNIREGLKYSEIENKIKAFKQVGGAYSYYLGDDLKCKDKDIIDNIRSRIGIKKGMVGVKKGIKCYPNDDILVYHYPLMRREISLAEMLKDQVKEVSKVRSQGQNIYIFVQTHPQFWYQEIATQGGAGKKALLYPDGQTTRMLVYYAVATGANGYFLYNSKSLSGDESRERSIGSAQAILETRGLSDAISRNQSIEFFQKGNDIYGSVVKGVNYDIIFVFNSDVKTHYHPAAKPIKMDLKDLVQTKKYKSVLQYLPYGSSPAGDKVEVPQDRALILIGIKDKGNVSSLELDAGGMKLYSELLSSRAERLAQNMKALGASVPELKEDAKNLKDKIVSLLAYIDSLNEIKRDIWWKKAGKLPTDGDIFNTLYWKKEPTKPTKGDIFNFYYEGVR